MELKQPYGRGKTRRLSGRITEAFSADLKKLADQTGVSQTELLELAFYEFRKDVTNFINCPHCQAPYYPSALLSVTGTLAGTCNRCGEKFEIET